MKNLIIRINFILMLGIVLCVAGIAGGIQKHKVLASEKVVDHTKEGADNSGESKEEIKVLSSMKITKDNINNIKPEDIKEKELKKIVIGPKTRKKLNLDKDENTVSQNCDTSNGRPVTLNITFYTDLNEENGGCGGYVSNNKRIAPGMVASPFSYGTKLYIPSFGKHIAGLDGINVFSAEDRMAASEEAKADNRVDVYVPRVGGESDYQYSARVNSYGRYSVKAYILN